MIRSQYAPAPTTRATATIASTPSTTAPTSRRLGSATRGRFSPRGQPGFIVMFTRELTLGFFNPYIHSYLASLSLSLPYVYLKVLVAVSMRWGGVDGS